MNTPSDGVLQTIDLEAVWAERFFAGLGNDSQVPARADTLVLCRRRKLPALMEPAVLSIPSAPGPVNSKIRASELPALNTYSVQIAPNNSPDKGSSTDASTRLPYGMPRYVNVRTLKAMFGADRQDPLFRRVPSTDDVRWEICSDSYLVDIRDKRQIFKLGKLQIAS